MVNRSEFLSAALSAAAIASVAGKLDAASAGHADLIIHGGRVTTLDAIRPEVTAIAVRDGRLVAIGSAADVMRLRTPTTTVVDVRGRRVIPGLNDSHIHLIRGGLNYNMELRWEGVPSVADALRMLKVQASRTPAPQWVRVVGGWTEFQFAEKRMPTLEEINVASPDTPVFVLNLYRQAFLNKAALKAVGYTKDMPQPAGAEIQRDRRGNPTGLIIAEPNAAILYATLAKGPHLGPDDQGNSTLRFMRELNRLGITSCIDAGGGFQNYPDDYATFARLAKDRKLTVRTAYNLFTQHPGGELADYRNWVSTTKPYHGDAFYRHNGAGEVLVYSALDFEDIAQPRPTLPAVMDSELHGVVTLLAENAWPFRIHATYGESIRRDLDVLEAVNREAPLSRARWWLDHAETISDDDIERVKALGGGIAIQDRMAFQGEYFVERYGTAAARRSPPINRFLAAGIPVGAGTDATRVSSYNPWVSLYWLVTGNTVGGTRLYDADNRLDRLTALRLYTAGSAWFSNEERVKGALSVGMYADFAVLSEDYMTVDESRIPEITSLLTVVDGKVVHGADDFASLAPPLPKASPDWSPGNAFPPVAPHIFASPGSRDLSLAGRHAHVHDSLGDFACFVG